MRIGKREQIVIGVVSSVALIAGLHLMVFQTKASDFQNAKASYEELKRSVESSGQPRPWIQINEFERKTVSRQIEFWELMRDMNATLPPQFRSLDPENLTWQRGQIYDLYQELMARRASEQGPELTFLGQDGWNLLAEFPEEVVRAGTEVSDILQDLWNADAVIQRSDEGVAFQREMQYRQQLNRIALNLDVRDQRIEPFFGDVPSVLYTFNRIDLVQREVEPAELNYSNEADYFKKLTELFRLDWDGFDKLAAYKQLGALNGILDIAGESDVGEVRRVVIHEGRTTVPRGPAGTTPTPTPEPEPGAGFGGWGDWGDDGGRFGGMGGFPGMPGMGGFPGMGGPGMGPAAQEEEDDDLAANVIPLEITVFGTNRAVMDFIYRLSNVRASYTVDKVELISTQGEGDEQEVGANLYVYSYNLIFKPEEMSVNITQQEIEEKLEGLVERREMLEGLVAQGGGQTSSPDGSAPAPAGNPAAGMGFGMPVPGR